MRPCALACLLLAGCAAPSGTPSIPKAGRGIAEYRELARQAHQAVADAVRSLEVLDGAKPGGASVPASRDPELARFDRAFNQLELTSIRARARAEAIIARGQNYFDEWRDQLATGTNQPSGQADYNRLYGHFRLIRQRSGEVREQFRPFMAGLRQFRASLDSVAADVRRRTSPDEIDALTTSGRRVLKSLESVSAALNDAEAELNAKLTARR
jgi:hypothetical protein